MTSRQTILAMFFVTNGSFWGTVCPFHDFQDPHGLYHGLNMPKTLSWEPLLFDIATIEKDLQVSAHFRHFLPWQSDISGANSLEIR